MRRWGADRRTVKEIVASQTKMRFEIREMEASSSTGAPWEGIRAFQGHSAKVPVSPQEMWEKCEPGGVHWRPFLLHGTLRDLWPSIVVSGIKAGGHRGKDHRSYVHLVARVTSEPARGLQGVRDGSDTLVQVRAEALPSLWYVKETGVYLTDEVGPEALEEIRLRENGRVLWSRHDEEPEGLAELRAAEEEDDREALTVDLTPVRLAQEEADRQAGVIYVSLSESSEVSDEEEQSGDDESGSDDPAKRASESARGSAARAASPPPARSAASSGDPVIWPGYSAGRRG